jgi:hypothetical protein
MTKFARRAHGEAAPSQKLPRKPSAVNWRPIGAVVRELVTRLGDNRGGNFQPGNPAD